MAAQIWGIFILLKRVKQIIRDGAYELYLEAKIVISKKKKKEKCSVE